LDTSATPCLFDYILIMLNMANDVNRLLL
jgi:hypothetical protein